MEQSGFLPISKGDMASRGIDTLDFVFVSGDAYIDHPSFGAAVITRHLESLGYRVGIVAQPDWRDTGDISKLGKPKLGFLVSGGNVDSMVAHYTAAKKKRNSDYYSPEGRAGLRPDRAVIVYCNLIRRAFGDVPIVIGGLEASLRRFAHYDYWDDKVRRSILVDSGADILVYGMGEGPIAKIAELLSFGIPVKKIKTVRGTAVLYPQLSTFNFQLSTSYDILKHDKTAYAKAFALQYENNDHVTGQAVAEGYGDRVLVQNPPWPPLGQRELDRVYALPYMRDFHPCYRDVPAIEEVKFSITHTRGCFGGCNFCALSFHQGRSVRSRSQESVVKEARLISELPDFKGYIHDIGGPTANFRKPSCQRQLKEGMCKNKSCLAPPCENLEVGHGEYMALIEAVEALPKVKRVFVRSGIRFDYLMLDSDRSFFEKLVRDNTSGQLKVAPEHVSEAVLAAMGKPGGGIYEKFSGEFYGLCGRFGKEQYLVPYFMSSHPGSGLPEALELALWLKKTGHAPEQVQDFYPTPGTASTCMFYTGLNPFTGEAVYVPDSYGEKKLQRALLQSAKPENRPLVLEACNRLGRGDVFGFLTDSTKR